MKTITLLVPDDFNEGTLVNLAQRVELLESQSSLTVDALGHVHDVLGLMRDGLAYHDKKLILVIDWTEVHNLLHKIPPFT